MRFLFILLFLAALQLGFSSSVQHRTAARMIVPKKRYACSDSRCELLSNGDADYESGLSQSSCLLTCGQGSLWPYPQQAKIGKRVTVFHFDQIRFALDAFKDDPLANLLQSAKANFQSLLAGIAVKEAVTTVHNAQIVISFDIADRSVIQASYDNDESYSLSISTSSSEATVVKVEISAVTFFGARHGLETLAQLIGWDDLSDAWVIASDVSIEDKPAFPYRGVMLDVSRNFLTVAKIKETIRAMGFNKLNVLHLHLSDTASFPVLLRQQVNVTKYGAYDDSRLYDADALHQLAAFANIHGVMILPEIETPAHVGAGWQWGSEAGLGDLALCMDPQGTHGDQWTTDALEPPSGHLNIVNEHALRVLDGVYKEIIAAFPLTGYFHFGGDEVIVGSDESWAACYNSSTLAKPIIDYIEDNNLDRQSQETFYGLWKNFSAHATSSLQTSYGSLGAQLKKLHVWGGGGVDEAGVVYNMLTQPDVNSVYSPKLFNIQVWDTSDDSITPKLLNDGYSVVLSNTDYVYFDCGNAGPSGAGGYWCQPYHEWYHIYQYVADVTAKWSLTADQLSRILGSEALAWAEMIDDSNISQKLWPRAAALAEALWTNPLTSWYAASERMMQWRKTLVGRGIPAEALVPYWCTQRAGDACMTDSGTPQRERKN